MKFLKNEELGRPLQDAYANLTKMPVVVILDNVRSGLNVGSVFRTSDSFLVEKLVLCGITSKPPERDILKSALGATESVAWQYFTTSAEAVEDLKSQGYLIYAIEQSDSSISLDHFQPVDGSKYALIFGNEVKGVDPALIPLLDGAIEVPQSGIKHSLNISVCAGVVLWSFYEKIVLN